MAPGVLNHLIFYNNSLELKGITVMILLKFQLILGGFQWRSWRRKESQVNPKVKILAGFPPLGKAAPELVWQKKEKRSTCFGRSFDFILLLNDCKIFENNFHGLCHFYLSLFLFYGPEWLGVGEKWREEKSSPHHTFFPNPGSNIQSSTWFN